MSQYCKGGVFHDSLHTKRAAAEIEVHDDQVIAHTPEEIDCVIDLQRASVDMGGATGKMLFLYSEDRQTVIYSEDPAFALLLKDSSVQEKVQKVLEQHQKEGQMMTLLWLSVFAIIGGLGFWGYQSLPQLSALAIDAIPTNIDVELGDFAYKNMDQEGVEIQSAQIVEPIEQIVHRLTENLEKDWEFKVHVVDADILNAYALPGGNIVVYTGLIEKSTTPEELAGVLAHEIAHVTHRHGMSRILEAAGVALVANVVLGNVEGLLALGVELFSASAVNSYSRDAETEADLTGLTYLQQAQINPEAMVSFFEIMESEEGELEEAIPLWMRSHPETNTRIETLQQEIKQLPQQSYRDIEINWIDYQQLLKQY